MPLRSSAEKNCAAVSSRLAGAHFRIRQPHTPAIVEESWELQSRDGDSIQLQIQYVRGTMTTRKVETVTYSAAKPDFYRIYRSEQSSDVVRDSESDRVQTFVFKA